MGTVKRHVVAVAALVGVIVFVTPFFKMPTLLLNDA